MAQFDQTSASRAVLIEVANVLGAFRNELVLIGGWVPELHYPHQGHIGSLDVDLAVSPALRASDAYHTILKRMLDAGYSHHTNPTHFLKPVAGAPEPVKVDLITGQSHDGGQSSSIQIDELRIGCLKGVELAFLAYDEVSISGQMPSGTENVVRARIARPEVFILIKAFALDERTKEKDAYDVAFILHHYQPSLAALAERVRPHLTNGLARQGYEILQAKFASINSVGPDWAAIVARTQGQDYEQARRAAYNDAQELFGILKRES